MINLLSLNNTVNGQSIKAKMQSQKSDFSEYHQSSDRFIFFFEKFQSNFFGNWSVFDQYRFGSSRRVPEAHPKKLNRLFEKYRIKSRLMSEAHRNWRKLQSFSFLMINI
jgi:hypothetical protein